MMLRSRDDALRWTAQGTQLCERALGTLSDDALLGASALAGWDRRHVVAHLVGNADALLNLVVWARTGVERPMYASPEQRNADIEAGAALAPSELRRRFAESRSDFAVGVAQLSDEAWSAEVRTAQGRVVPAAEVPWLRAREVMVHAVDLQAGVVFDDLPEDFLVALIDDVMTKRGATPGHPPLLVTASGHSWRIEADGDVREVSGTPAHVAGILTGRVVDVAGALPAWL